MQGGAWWRVALWTVLVIAAIGFIYLVRGILLPFVLAWLIAVVLEPPVAFLEKRGLKRGLAITAVILAFFVVLGGIGFLAAPRITSQLGELRGGVQRITEFMAQEEERRSVFVRWNPSVQAQPSSALAWADDRIAQFAPLLERVGVPSTTRGLYLQYIEPQQESIASGVTSFFNGFVSLLIGASSQVFLLFFTPLIAFVLLNEMGKLKVTSVKWVPPSIRHGTVEMIQDLGKVFKGYLRGVLINLAIYITLIAVVLTIFGAPYSLLLALVAGTFYLIPMIGGFFSTPTILLVIGFSGQSGPAWMGSPGPWTFAVIVAVAFIVISMAYDMTVQPRVIGKAVDLHILLAIFVVLSGSALFGLPGMILAYPVAGMIKVIVTRLLALTTSAHPDDNRLPAVPLRHRTSTE